MKCAAFVFSATGNSARALRVAAGELRAGGHAVYEFTIAKGKPAPVLDPYDLVVFAFPVLAKAPPVMVTRFIKALPCGRSAGGSRKRAAVMAIDGGGGGFAANRAALLLEKRGFETVAVAKPAYPANWAQVLGIFDDRRAAELLASGDATSKEFGARLSRGASIENWRGEKKTFLDIALPPLFGLIGRRFLGKIFFADGDCDSCGLCARTCPSGTILLTPGKGQRPFWKMDCENCNRCINVCPRGAIVSSIGRGAGLSIFIVAAAWAGILAYRYFAWPLAAAALPAMASAALDVLAIAAIIVAAHFLAIGPIDSLVVRHAQHLPPIRRFFSWTYTKGQRRYLAPGFKPERR
jgi:ferredoxin